MTSFQDKLDALPEVPSAVTFNFDKGYSPSDSQLIDALEARLALAKELLEETLRLLRSMTTEDFAKYQKSDAIAFLEKLDSEGL